VLIYSYVTPRVNKHINLVNSSRYSTKSYVAHQILFKKTYSWQRYHVSHKVTIETVRHID